MRALISIHAFIIALWLGAGLILMMWNFYLWLQMNNHRVPKQRPMWEFQRAAFQTDPADYTEIGEAYRRKSIWVQAAMPVWLVIGMIGLPIVFK
jgi:hypothetical protein